MSSPIDLQPEQFAPANGLSICYQCFGQQQNPPLLLIMGLATQMIHWDDAFCQQLADQGFWVIRFDNRDIGKSTKLTGQAAPGMAAVAANQWFNRPLKVPYKLMDMANDTLGLLNHLEIDKAHIVGVSMGGMIAQCMAIGHSARVASLTSIMSTTGNRKLPKPSAQVMLKIMRPVPKEPNPYLAHVLDMWKMLHGDTYEFDPVRVSSILTRAR